MGSFELSSSSVVDGGCAEEKKKKLQSLKRLGFWNLTPLKVKICCTAITSRRATAAFLLSSCPVPSCVMSVMCISSGLSCNACPMPPPPVVCQGDKLINVSVYILFVPKPDQLVIQTETCDCSCQESLCTRGDDESRG